MKQVAARLNQSKTALYAGRIVPEIPRLLSLLDREFQSVSFGSFDREHWGWKFRDFPITMLQSAIYPLALLWRYPFPESPYYQNEGLFGWIQGAIENTCRRQHENGAFDSVGPYTQDYGVSLAMAYILAEALRVLDGELATSAVDAVCRVVRRSCDFAFGNQEDYSFISNHQALFALAFHKAYDLLGERKYQQRADGIIDSILQAQSPDGWYREYEGPDPGYESLGIFYLATYWRETRSPRLLESLRRAVEFYTYCVHPDGSVGGVYGSRHTCLYYPAGFEILASEIPMAAAVARFMRARLYRQNVVTPAVSDAENLPSLTYTYLEACFVEGDQDPASSPDLPCRTLDGIRHFPDSSLSVIGNRHYYAVLNPSKGGVGRIFNKRTERLAYEDAGYVVRAGRHLWTSQLIGLGHRLDSSLPNELACETRLAQVRQEMPTPAKFVLLRLMNLTLFRSQALGSWVRRLVIERLITARRVGPFTLSRVITFGQDQIHFHDRLKMETSMRVDDVALPRTFMAIHMGSAKYFHLSDLEATPQATVEGMAGDLNRKHVSECEFTLYFSGDVENGIGFVPDDRTRNATREEVLVKP